MISKTSLLLAISLALASPLMADSTAIQPASRDAKWLARHEGFVAEARQGKAGLLFLGDSITDFWRYAEGQEVWRHYFAPHQTVNFGIQSDRTEHVLWRIQNGELDGIDPKVAEVMIGTNNTGANTAVEIAEGVKAIVGTIRQKKPSTKVLLLGIFPRGTLATDPLRQKIKDTNAILAKLDDGQQIRYLDIGIRFLDPDGTLPKKIMPDGTHPNKGGYQIWAKAMEPLLTEMMK